MAVTVPHYDDDNVKPGSIRLHDAANAAHSKLLPLTMDLQAYHHRIYDAKWYAITGTDDESRQSHFAPFKF